MPVIPPASTAHFPATLEIAVQDPVGAKLARDLGADRVELCAALVTGGLTPSAGLVESVLDATAGSQAFVHVLVRPREGGFIYDAGELATAVRDVKFLARSGVGGVVVGALTPDGSIDLSALDQLVAAAGDMAVTFHRAIDAAGDPFRIIEQLRGRGVDRVLTSGGAARSIDGINTISAMAQASEGIEIMAGGGVGVGDIEALLSAGAHAVHLSARTPAAQSGEEGPGGGTPGYDVTDPLTVADAVAAVAAFNNRN